MSKQLFAIPLLLLSLLLGACSDEEEGRINIDDSAPAQVTNVVATSVAGGVTLSWDIPSSKSFMYTKLAYTNAKGAESYELYSKEHADDAGKMQTTINGFVKTEPVTFKLFACSVRGNNSGAVEVQGTPSAPNFAKVLDKITVDPSYGGIKVGYINEFDENVNVSVSYKSTSDASKSGSCKFAVSPKSQGAQFVRLTYGNDNQFITNEKCEITIHTEDNYDNASDDRTYQVTPLAAQILDRSKWSVPGYDNNSSAATIGYDSQEAVGEGASKVVSSVCLMAAPVLSGIPSGRTETISILIGSSLTWEVSIHWLASRLQVVSKTIKSKQVSKSSFAQTQVPPTQATQVTGSGMTWANIALTQTMMHLKILT